MFMRADDRLVCTREIPESIRQHADSFWRHVTKASDCWHFHANDTYGRFRGFSAHRVAYRLAVGPIPVGYVIAHKCDNKRCCNPSHLEAVTSGKNNRDAHARSITHEQGEQRYNAILNESLVREIVRLNRELGLGRVRISRRLGIRANAVKKVLEGRTWSHITGIEWTGPEVPYATQAYRHSHPIARSVK